MIHEYALILTHSDYSIKLLNVTATISINSLPSLFLCRAPPTPAFGLVDSNKLVALAWLQNCRFLLVN